MVTVFMGNENIANLFFIDVMNFQLIQQMRTAIDQSGSV